MLAALLWVASALARCPEPGEVRLSLLYPRDTAAASAVSGASFHRDAVLSLTASPQQQVLRGQLGLCDWMLAAEVRGDVLEDGTLSPVLGAAWSRGLGRCRITAAGLAGLDGADPLLSARLRLSRPSVRLTPYLLGEGGQVFSGAGLPEGWRAAAAAGLGYGLRDRIGLSLAATAELVPEQEWGGQLGLHWKL